MDKIQAVITWYDLAKRVLFCIDELGERRAIPADRQITVVMNGTTVKTMPAHFLSLYKFRGDRIERIVEV